MTTLTLYQVSDELTALIDSAIDPDTGELLPAFEQARGLFESKAAQVAAYVLNTDATAAAIHEHIKAMERKAKALATRSQHLRAYLQTHMARCGITQIASEDGTFKATLYPGRDESVELDPDAVFPPELCNAPKPPTPSKTLIKASIMAGQPVSGARIVRHDRLTIK